MAILRCAPDCAANVSRAGSTSRCRGVEKAALRFDQGACRRPRAGQPAEFVLPGAIERALFEEMTSAT